MSKKIGRGNMRAARASSTAQALNSKAERLRQDLSPSTVAPAHGALRGPTAPAISEPAAPPAGWFPDPRGEKRLRYWDGATWTDAASD